jgi:site-specific recombinase XerD
VRSDRGQRIVPIHPTLEPLFVGYLRVRAHDPEPALIVGMHGRRLSQTILTFLRYAHAAGVTERKRVTPHTLRHVFASSSCVPVRTYARSRSRSATSTSTRRSDIHA